MKSRIYLIFGREGIRRMRKTTPWLAKDEVGVRLNIEILSACFRSPIIDAQVVVPEDWVIQPDVTIEAMGGDQDLRRET